jgi:hypothetical protein
MGPDGTALRYTAEPDGSGGWIFGDPAWGEMGPSVTTAKLKERGWLADAAIFRPPANLSTAAGGLTLSPVYRERQARSGIVRAEIGPYALELRVPSGWDRKIGKPIVLATGPAGEQVLKAGDSVSWGGDMPELTGGGAIEITAITNDYATIGWHVRRKAVFVAGGGKLLGGGTILLGTDGRIHRIPPGDPDAKQVRELIGELAQIAKRVP